MKAGAFLYTIYMIYTLIAIPFGAAALYNITAGVIAKRCFRELKDGEAEEMGLSKEDAKGAQIFDVEKAGRYLAVMAVCYYPAYPLLMIQKWLNK